MTPLSGVVVGVDFSTSGGIAAHWAASTAAMHRCRLLLLHSEPVPAPYADHADWALSPSRLPTSMSSTSHTLTDLGNEIRKDHPGLEVVTWLTHEHPAVALLAEAADGVLVVVGRRPPSDDGHVSAGPVELQVLQHANTSVAVVSGPRSPDDGAVVVGVDGAADSADLVSFAFEEASRRGVVLRIVHVANDFGYYYGEWTSIGPTSPELTSGVRSAIAATVEPGLARYPGVRVEHCTRKGDPSEVFIEESRTAQLLVLGAHGRANTPRPMLGSVTHNVALAATCPVVVIPVHSEERVVELPRESARDSAGDTAPWRRIVTAP